MSIKFSSKSGQVLTAKIKGFIQLVLVLSIIGAFILILGISESSDMDKLTLGQVVVGLVSCITYILVAIGIYRLLEKAR